MKNTGRLFTILTLTGYLLTLLTFFWGAPFLRVLWSRFGSRTYWLAGAVGSIISYAMVGSLWTYLAGVWILIGIFSELEFRGVRWFWNGLLSLLVSASFLLVGSWYHYSQVGVSTTAQLAEKINSFLNTVNNVKLPEGFDIEGMIYQIPSVVLIGMIITLAHGLIFEKAVCRWFNIPRERPVAQIRLLEFRLPDAFVWIGMVSFLGMTQEWGGKIVSQNILNVCVALFFFQGLAVLEFFYKALRVGMFVRALGYFLFVFQLFVVLSFVGFVDFWVDFRNRIRRMMTKAQATGM